MDGDKMGTGYVPNMVVVSIIRQKKSEKLLSP